MDLQSEPSDEIQGRNNTTCPLKTARSTTVTTLIIFYCHLSARRVILKMYEIMFGKDNRCYKAHTDTRASRRKKRESFSESYSWRPRDFGPSVGYTFPLLDSQANFNSGVDLIQVYLLLIASSVAPLSE